MSLELVRGMTSRVIIAAISLCLPLTALAQDVRPTLPPTSVPIFNVPVGATIRVATTPGAHIEGVLISAEDSVLTFALNDVQRRIPYAEVDTLWIQRGSTMSGAVMGGLLSALALSMLLCRPSCDESGVLFPGIMITPLPGLAVGALIGSLAKRWERRFP